MPSMPIKEMPLEERPRERLLLNGVSSLSNADLLAIMISSGNRKLSVLTVANLVLKETGGISGVKEMSIAELTKIPGIGKTKAMQIVAGIEFGKRVLQAKTEADFLNTKIKTPEDCMKHISAGMKFHNQEHFVVLYLDVKQRLIKQETLFIGSLDRADIHPREIFRGAVKNLAASIICVHNHPSNDLTPSQADIFVTNQLVSAGDMMGIPLIDHLIVGRSGFTSLKSLGHI